MLVVQLCLILLLCPRNSPGKNTGVGIHSLFQGVFRTQGLNPGPPVFSLQVDSKATISLHSNTNEQKQTPTMISL